MDDSTNTTPRNGATNRTSAGTHSGEQPLPSDTLNRTNERTCTQKITIPTLKKQDNTNANKWWRKFVHYIKMTKDLDLSKMTNNKRNTATIPWSIRNGDKGYILMGKMRSRKWPKRLERENQAHFRYTNYTHCFDYTYTGENCSTQQNWFFSTSNWKTRCAANVWKRIQEVGKNCEVETITAAELLASKFLSVIGKSTGDYDLKKKIRKSDMSIEAITEALHEHMYEKLNDSPETEEKKIRYRRQRIQKNCRTNCEKRRRVSQQTYNC